MTIHAATFFRGHADETRGLLVDLIEQGDADVIHLFDNGDDPEVLGDILRGVPERADIAIYRCSDLCLTEMWNMAWNAAKELGAHSLAILNNDITIGSGFLRRLDRALSDHDLWVSCPNYNRRVADGSYFGGVQIITGCGAKRNGMPGWAFMVDMHRPWPTPPVDTLFRWWCGDDDISLTVQASGGRIGMVMGLPVDHDLSMTWGERPELIPIAQEDLARCRAKWGAMFPW